MSRKVLKMLLVCTITAGMVTGCGASDSFKEGVKDGIKDATESVSASSVSEEPEETPTETPTEEPTPAVESDSQVAAESETPETGNPLLDAEMKVEDVMNGVKTEKIGEYAYVVVPLETMKNVTMEQYADFCEQRVADSGYNWVTIDFGNGTGLQFAGSVSVVSTYGKLDNEECIEESYGTVMLTGDRTYEYSESEQ